MEGKDIFDTLLTGLANAAPETHKCNCKVEGKQYNQQDDQCKKCYAAGKMLEAALVSAAKAGDIDFVMKLLVGSQSPNDTEDLN